MHTFVKCDLLTNKQWQVTYARTGCNARTIDYWYVEKNDHCVLFLQHNVLL